MTASFTCGVCNATGYLGTAPCKECDGHGFIVFSSECCSGTGLQADGETPCPCGLEPDATTTQCTPSMYCTDPNYEKLFAVLKAAFEQSATGKGKERHANGKAFEKQPILEIARMVGIGGHTYQIMKKAQEASGMTAQGAHDAAIQELLGVIVYAAAGVVLIEERKSNS